MAFEREGVGQTTGRLGDTDPTNNPSNDVYVVSTGINPDLIDQSEAEAALALDPPKDQIPAVDTKANDEGAQQAAADERQDRLDDVVDDGQTEDQAPGTTGPNV